MGLFGSKSDDESTAPCCIQNENIIVIAGNLVKTGAIYFWPNSAHLKNHLETPLKHFLYVRHTFSLEKLLKWIFGLFLRRLE